MASSVRTAQHRRLSTPTTLCADAHCMHEHFSRRALCRHTPPAQAAATHLQGLAHSVHPRGTVSERGAREALYLSLCVPAGNEAKQSNMGFTDNRTLRGAGARHNRPSTRHGDQEQRGVCPSDSRWTGTGAGRHGVGEPCGPAGVGIDQWRGRGRRQGLGARGPSHAAERAQAAERPGRRGRRKQAGRAGCCWLGPAAQSGPGGCGRCVTLRPPPMPGCCVVAPQAISGVCALTGTLGAKETEVSSSLERVLMRCVERRALT